VRYSWMHSLTSVFAVKCIWSCRQQTAQRHVMIKVKFLDKDSRILPEMSAKVAFLERLWPLRN